jgi:hypothetical protein
MADHALMDETRDAGKIFRSRTPSGADFARQTGEAAVVVGDKVLPDSVGGVQIDRCGQAQFAAEAIWEYPTPPKAFEPSLGLGNWAAMKVMPS